jgi:hypothetical protein
VQANMSARTVTYSQLLPEFETELNANCWIELNGTLSELVQNSYLHDVNSSQHWSKKTKSTHQLNVGVFSENIQKWLVVSSTRFLHSIFSNYLPWNTITNSSFLQINYRKIVLASTKSHISMTSSKRQTISP